MRLMSALATALAALVATFAATVPAFAAWVDHGDDLGRDVPRIAVQGAVDYGALSGSEIDRAGAVAGFEVAVFRPVRGPFALWASFGTGLAEIDGQTTELLDIPVRTDRRSGYVLGDVTATRFRVGTRIDAFRERTWRFRPYATVAWVLSRVKLEVDSVDGLTPRPELRSNESENHGVLTRAGVEYPLFRNVSLDVAGSFEALEIPPASNNVFSIVGGLTLRL